METQYPTAPAERSYPIQAPVEDQRFTLGLALDVAQVLLDHGYPRVMSGGDLVALEQALFAFIYRPVAAGTGLDYSREADDPVPVSPARGLAVGAPLSQIAEDGHTLPRCTRKCRNQLLLGGIDHLATCPVAHAEAQR